MTWCKFANFLFGAGVIAAYIAPLEIKACADVVLAYC
jgi:hypothetical protein